MKEMTLPTRRTTLVGEPTAYSLSPVTYAHDDADCQRIPMTSAMGPRPLRALSENITSVAPIPEAANLMMG
jgi:hypothetical protein